MTTPKRKKFPVEWSARINVREPDEASKEMNRLSLRVARQRSQLEGVADRVARRVRRREMWAGALGSVAALAGLPLVLWIYAWMLGQVSAPSGALCAVLVVVTAVAGSAAFACYLSATYGRVRLFDDEMRRAAQ